MFRPYNDDPNLVMPRGTLESDILWSRRLPRQNVLSTGAMAMDVARDVQ
jgi:hypothetical protein